MSILLVCLLLATSAPSEAEAPCETGVGSICLAPVEDDGDPRDHVSSAFSVRVDKGQWIAVPGDKPKRIADVSLEGRHLVAIRDGTEITESFWFSFESYQSSSLCLWYKPWYRTWSLWDSALGGKKCHCAEPEQANAR